MTLRKNAVEIEFKRGADPKRGFEQKLPHYDHVERRKKGFLVRVPIALKSCGGAVRIVDSYGRSAAGPKVPSPSLTIAIARAHVWRSRLVSGEVGTIAEIANEELVTEAFVSNRLRLAYLAPDIVTAALTGAQPEGLTLEQIIDANFPFEWRAQRRLFGFETV